MLLPLPRHELGCMVQIRPHSPDLRLDLSGISPGRACHRLQALQLVSSLRGVALQEG